VAQRVGRGIALLFHDHGTRRGWVVSSMPRPHFTPGKEPVLILQETGWTPGPVWTGGKARPHRNSIPDRPARSQSLYRLSYLAHRGSRWETEKQEKKLFIFESSVFHSDVAEVAAVLLEGDSAIPSIFIRRSDAIDRRSRNLIMIIRKQFMNLSSTWPRNTPPSTEIEGSLPLSEKCHFHQVTESTTHA